MTYQLNLLLIFGVALIFEGIYGALLNFDDDPNQGLNAMQIIRKYGYPAEAYTVETKDGYLLEMHRIPHGRNGNSELTEKPPIYIQHGILCSSASFVLLGPEKSLPFILADMGYDVWLGNARGNTYSRAHVSLKPFSRQFWNFTWHESGMFDTSAMIDFVLSTTQKEKLLYMGHSMGTTVFFVLLSMLPEYNEKVEAAFLMAPVAYLGHQRSPLLKIVAPISEEFRLLSLLFGSGEFLPNAKLFTYISRLLCSREIDSDICLDLIYLVVGDDPREYNKEVMDIFINHFPEGYSTKAIEHYSQLIKSNEFRLYSYGRRRNMRQYGQRTPPRYNLENIKIPIYLYVGKNDYLSDVMDVDRLSAQLCNVKRYFLVDYCKFSHLDFLVGKDVRAQLYDSMIEDVRKQVEGENDNVIPVKQTYGREAAQYGCYSGRNFAPLFYYFGGTQRGISSWNGHSGFQSKTSRSQNDVPQYGTYGMY